MYRIRELRKERHMNQQRLAMEFNISQAAVSNYEKGNPEPDIQLIIKMADYFNVSIDYLAGKSDKKFNISADDLKDDEMEILQDYSRLSEIKKAKASAYIKGLLQD